MTLQQFALGVETTSVAHRILTKAKQCLVTVPGMKPSSVHDPLMWEHVCQTQETEGAEKRSSDCSHIMAF
jgi:hypothetical protein